MGVVMCRMDVATHRMGVATSGLVSPVYGISSHAAHNM